MATKTAMPNQKVSRYMPWISSAKSDLGLTVDWGSLQAASTTANATGASSTNLRRIRELRNGAPSVISADISLLSPLRLRLQAMAIIGLSRGQGQRGLLAFVINLHFTKESYIFTHYSYIITHYSKSLITNRSGTSLSKGDHDYAPKVRSFATRSTTCNRHRLCVNCTTCGTWAGIGQQRRAGSNRKGRTGDQARKRIQPTSTRWQSGLYLGLRERTSIHLFLGLLV